jgi:hypothetical protein
MRNEIVLILILTLCVLIETFYWVTLYIVEVLFFQEMVSNAVVFVLAGYETTSTALSYAAHELASHPEVQRRLQEELDTELSVVGDGQSKTHRILSVVKCVGYSKTLVS